MLKEIRKEALKLLHFQIIAPHIFVAVVFRVWLQLPEEGHLCCILLWLRGLVRSFLRLHTKELWGMGGCTQARWINVLNNVPQ